VGVGPLVVRTQAAKLIEPGKRPLHGHRHVPNPLPCAVWPQPASAVKRRNPSTKGIPIRQAHGEKQRCASNKSDDACSRVWPIGWIRPGLVTPIHRADGTTCTTARDQLIWSSRASQSNSAKLNQILHAPSCQSGKGAASTSSRSTSEFLRKHLSGNAAAKDEDDGAEARAIRTTAAHFLGLACRDGIGKSGSTRTHNARGSSVGDAPLYPTSPTRDQVSEVLLRALRLTRG
jgi:hypothetical protein